VAAHSSSSENEAEHVRWLDNADKVVFSKCLDKVEWQNPRIVRENIPEEIAAMRCWISRYSEEARYERRRSAERA
jgi:hypothetical protein